MCIYKNRWRTHGSASKVYAIKCIGFRFQWLKWTFSANFGRSWILSQPHMAKTYPHQHVNRNPVLNHEAKRFGCEQWSYSLETGLWLSFQQKNIKHKHLWNLTWVPHEIRVIHLCASYFSVMSIHLQLSIFSACVRGHLLLVKQSGICKHFKDPSWKCNFSGCTFIESLDHWMLMDRPILKVHFDWGLDPMRDIHDEGCPHQNLMHQNNTP